MKILIVGADDDNAIERYYVKYLSKKYFKENLLFFKAKNIFNNYYNKSLWNKVFYRLGISVIVDKINNQLKNYVFKNNPDVLIVFKGMEIKPSTLIWIKSRGIKLINYNTDNPFLFTGKGSGNKNIVHSLGIYNLLLTYDNSIREKLIDTYNIPSKILPFGYEIDNNLRFEHSTEILKVCFIGNSDIYRISFLNKLAEEGIEIDLYGVWPKRKLHSNINYLGKLDRGLLFSTILKYRIQLNILRVHNKESHNMRTFEIPAIGGIQLAPLTEDHNNLFLDNKEIFLYNGLQQCVDKIKYLLSLSVTESKEIRKLAKERCFQSDYSYENRTDLLYNYIKDL